MREIAPRSDRSTAIVDAPTAALIRVAAAMADAPDELLERLVQEAKAAGTPGAWLDELVLAGVLFVGFPRALVVLAAVRREFPEAGPEGDAADYAAWQRWKQRGEQACRKIYGANYDKLRANVRAMHPVLDAWILMDGYGRTMSRPGLDMARRELCSIAMLVPQRTPRQLHSHLRGALNCGASAEQVEAVFDLVATLPCVPADRIASSVTVWRGMQ